LPLRASRRAIVSDSQSWSREQESNSRANRVPRAKGQAFRRLREATVAAARRRGRSCLAVPAGSRTTVAGRVPSTAASCRGGAGRVDS